MLVKDRPRRRLVGQIGLWAGLLVLPAGLVLAGLRMPAYAGILAAHLAAIGIPAASPSPSPSPSATPHPAYQTIRGGPITFEVTGNLLFGSRSQSSSYGGIPFPGVSPSPSSSPTPSAGFQSTNSVNQTTGSAGMTFQVNRRTATTMTTFSLPIGFGNQGTQVSTVQALYSTPRYSIGYATQQLLLFGQLPIGGTLRGFAFIVPNGSGSETLFEGPSTGVDGERLDLLGFRIAGARGPYVYEAGITQADGTLTGRSKTYGIGGATQLGDLGLVTEAAWQQRSGGDGGSGGPAYALRLDDGNGQNDLSFALRHISAGFVGFGAGENSGDNFYDASLRRGGALQSLLVDANWERIGSTTPGLFTTTRVGTLDYSGPWRLGSYNVGFQQQGIFTSSDPVQTQSSTAGTFQIGMNSNLFTAILGAQAQRVASDPGGLSSQVAYSAILERMIGQYTIAFQGQKQRLTLSTGGPTLQIAENASIARTWGRTSLQLGVSSAHTISAFSNAISFIPLATVTRQISPVVSIQASMGYQTLRDRINPQSNGHSRIFSLQLNAPVVYGNANVVGRVDPHRPATIAGRIQFEPDANASANSAMSNFSTVSGTNGGLGNAVVVLDDRYVQRTDVTGGFQFSFVPAGQHQLRVETSSLPRGITVDPPVLTLTIEGGQTAQASFQVGNFGGVIGRVYGIDSNGAQQPLANVMLRVDGGTYSQTDTNGNYGFGHLSPGDHSIAVVTSTVPAFASFDERSLTQKVVVRNGQYTKLDFGAQPLGSISGKIVYASDMHPLKGGVLNAYVVAEPGEHAAIDEDDGSFVIDNLPAGDYTVSVDQETLDEGLGSKPDGVPVHLDPQQHYAGLSFSVGHFEKKVVFSYVAGTAHAPTASVRLSEGRLPPNGTTTVTIDAPATAKSVSVTAFGSPIPLEYDVHRSLWTGQLEVPKDAKGGDYSIAGNVAGAATPAAATLAVDPKMPIALIQYSPGNPAKGSYVHVRARFLVDAREGDKIEWEDGAVTVLPKPISGRVFTFTVHLSLRPLHGLLLTKHSRLPIELL
jgi:hypothetical protein